MPAPELPVANSEGETPALGYATPSAPSEQVVIWCRILALLMLAFGVISLSRSMVLFVAGLFGHPSFIELVASTLFGGNLDGIVWLLLVWYCWRKAPRIATRIAPGQHPPASQGGASSDELLHTVTIGIGMYLLFDGLPSLGGLIYRFIEGMRAASFTGITMETFIPPVIRCGVGLWLILGTRGIVQLVRGRAGQWQDASSDQSS
jgi:hypothetical protein